MLDTLSGLQRGATSLQRMQGKGRNMTCEIFSYSRFRILERKEKIPKTLCTVDTLVDWKYHLMVKSDGLLTSKASWLIRRKCRKILQVMRGDICCLGVSSVLSSDKNGKSSRLLSGSSTHLIKDCDFYEKQMANKTVETTTVPTGKTKVPAPVPTGRQNRPIPVPTGRQNRPIPVSNEIRVYGQLLLSPQQVILGKHIEKVYTGYPRTIENSYTDAEDEGIFDSGCSRSMTGKMERLDDFQEFQGGKICDKKNRVLFTDTDYLVLSKDFKLLDESMVLLRVPRKHNLYTINLNNLSPKGNLDCLVAKASVDESVKWHRRMGHLARMIGQEQRATSVEIRYEGNFKKRQVQFSSTHGSILVPTGSFQIHSGDTTISPGGVPVPTSQGHGQHLPDLPGIYGIRIWRLEELRLRFDGTKCECMEVYDHQPKGFVVHQHPRRSTRRGTIESLFFLRRESRKERVLHPRSMIGSLMYLTASRPDIMFAVSACLRNQVAPTTLNLEAVKKIFKYLKGQPKLGLLMIQEVGLVISSVQHGPGGLILMKKSSYW
ncbi:hypothetical protein Tco_1514795 [Tanacetum coccineum]